jgi:hypothetical protein
MAFIGYARVSTHEQHLHLQQDALSYVRDGDTLVVWRLDRLGRSLKDLIERITDCTAETSALRASRKTSTPLPATPLTSWRSVGPKPSVNQIGGPGVITGFFPVGGVAEIISFWPGLRLPRKCCKINGHIWPNFRGLAILITTA